MSARGRGGGLSRVVVLTVTAVGLGFMQPARSGVATIEPGFDLFETDPQATAFNFPPFPPGFFGPGSDPFMGEVNFTGVPLKVFGGHNVGDTDTVVQRLDVATPPDTIPIEIVALNLVSVQPITVTYNGGQNPERWDVNASLSPTQSMQGQMTIQSTSPNGGTFDSQLPVFPLFTFTRLSDGQTRQLDAGFLPPPQATFQANAVPWRVGCVLPALSVPGLNDGFCPGLTPEGQKQRTVENAALARHGVYPAQPAPEHFKCYKVKPSGFKDRQVTLTDQFGTRTAKVATRKELCNPVRKFQELFQNKQAHLVCYTAPGVEPQRVVVVRNQFGSQQLVVRGSQRLCVPSEKRKPNKQFKPIQVPIDHDQCYAVEAQSPLERFGPLGKVRLKDQFGKEKVKVGSPKWLCAPVQKNAEGIQHPVNHLVCYAIRDEPKDIAVQIRNQFEKANLIVGRPRLLCVPSAKLAV